MPRPTSRRSRASKAAKPSKPRRAPARRTRPTPMRQRRAATVRQRRPVHATPRTGARRAALLRRTLDGRPKEMNVEFEDLGHEETPRAAPMPTAA